MKLYHYTSLDSFIKIWMSGHLLFADSNCTNDIFESKKISSLGNCKIPHVDGETDIEIMGHFMKMLWGEVNNYKQISLTQDYSGKMPGYSSPMMWGQYANKGNGVCFELNSDKLDLSSTDSISNPIEYTDEVPILEIEDIDLSSQDKILRFVEDKINDIFFKKHIHWQFENEYRLISKNKIFLDISKAVTNVYLPYKEDSVEFKIVDKLLEGSNVDIRVLTTTGSNIRKISSYNYSRLKEQLEKLNRN